MGWVRARPRDRRRDLHQRGRHDRAAQGRALPHLLGLLGPVSPLLRCLQPPRDPGQHARAPRGEPAWGVELLAREQLIGSLDSLGPFFNDWERWAADLTESHVNYPWLLWFRSPYPLRSWVVSLLAVLDAAASTWRSSQPGAVGGSALPARRLPRAAGAGRGLPGSSCPPTPDRTRRSPSPTRSSPTALTASRRSGSRSSGPGRRPGGISAGR